MHGSNTVNLKWLSILLIAAILTLGYPPVKSYAASGLTFTKIQTGYDFTVALATDGSANSVWAWGNPSGGVLGRGDEYGGSMPAKVNFPGGTIIIDIAVGYRSAFAVDSNGGLWSWGANSSGQLGTGNYSSQFTPAKIDFPGTDPYIVSVSAGQYHALALDIDGKVWAWGGNGFSQLGNGGSSASTVPQPVINFSYEQLSGISAVAAGRDFSMALSVTGAVYTWGGDESGQLGNGASGMQNKAAVIAIGNSDPIAKIFADWSAPNAFVIDTSNNVYGWGENYSGQLGIGNKIDQASPVHISSLPSNILRITAGNGDPSIGNGHVLAVAGDGTVYGAGDNERSQLLALGSPTTTFTAMNALSGIVDIVSGRQHALAIQSDGTAVGWGDNASRLLGVDSSVTIINSPELVMDLADSSATLTGTLVDAASSTPLASGIIVTVSLTGRGSRTGTTNASGQFVITGLEPGTHTVQALNIPGYNNLSSTLTVTAGSSLTQTFSLVQADPVNPNPSSLQFVDTDLDAGKLRGTLTWKGASPETDVYYYFVSFLDSAYNLVDMSKRIDKTTSGYQLDFAANSPIPSGAVWLAVTVNDPTNTRRALLPISSLDTTSTNDVAYRSLLRKQMDEMNDGVDIGDIVKFVASSPDVTGDAGAIFDQSDVQYLLKMISLENEIVLY